MGRYAINKSGSQLPVYSSVNGAFMEIASEQIGRIYHNECFAVTAEYWHVYEGVTVSSPRRCEQIKFRNSSGALQTGYIEYQVNTNCALSFLNYSFGNVTVNGTVYKSFKTRAALTYYDRNGNRKGTCTAGARVLTNDSTPGSSMPYLMNAMYVETGVGTGRWIVCSGITGQTGFIDTGIGSIGSDGSRIGVYGNW